MSLSAVGAWKAYRSLAAVILAYGFLAGVLSWSFVRYLAVKTSLPTGAGRGRHIKHNVVNYLNICTARALLATMAECIPFTT